MPERETWEDEEAKWSPHRSSVLLNRERRDLLARISIESVEAFSHFYMESHRLNEIEKQHYLSKGKAPPAKGQRLADDQNEWADEILTLSSSGQGWRATQVERIERSGHEDALDDGDRIETGGRGLKNQGG